MLKTQLEQIRTLMVKAAQEVYDAWQQDEEGLDDVYGGGGICDDIANALASVIIENVENVEYINGGQDGDDHCWIIVFNDEAAFEIDIPPYVYESGGGYNWRKIEGVEFNVNDILICETDLDLVKEAADYDY